MEVSVKGISFIVNETFKPDFWQLLNSGKWETTTYNIIDYYVKESNNVLDIGCWAGPVSLYMAKIGANVYALDPDPDAYSSLLENISLNPDLKASIHPYKIAIAEHNGNEQLYARVAYGNSSSSLLNRFKDNIYSEICKTSRLDNFLSNLTSSHIDFAKIDIEGAEFFIVEQLITAKKKHGFSSLILSLHYQYLNEFLYQEKFGSGLIISTLMKLERVFEIKFFQNKLHSYLKQILYLCEQYKFVYSITGDLLNEEQLTPEYFLKHKVDLFLTEKEWSKPS